MTFRNQVHHAIDCPFSIFETLYFVHMNVAWVAKPKFQGAGGHLLSEDARVRNHWGGRYVSEERHDWYRDVLPRDCKLRASVTEKGLYFGLAITVDGGAVRGTAVLIKRGSIAAW